MDTFLISLPIHWIMISRSVEKVVIARAGGLCEICGQRVVEDDKLIGMIAHIQGDKYGSARHDPNMSESQRNSPKNLILSCPTCHARIDKNPKKYTIVYLQDAKQRHKHKLEHAIGVAMPDIEFPELEEVVRYIASTDILLEQSYVLVPPQKKIQKNRLSSRWVMMGLSQTNIVGKYIDIHLDAESSRRLLAGFVKQYEELRNDGLDGDDLFMALWQFASRNNADPKMQAAGLALLVYLFEKCEVFEK